MDYEIFRTEKSRLLTTDLRAIVSEEPEVFGYGALLICRKGEADLRIDFRTWQLIPGSVLMLFPSDVVALQQATEDFAVEVLIYDRAMLREASLQLEHTVYEDLRRDRCRGNKAVVSHIVEGIFSLLRIYFRQEECQVKDQLVLYELKGFFLGYYDYLRQHPALPPSGSTRTGGESARRANELFNRFMELLETDYKKAQRVAYYAEQLHISPKYLTLVVRSINGLTPKAMIDHFVTMQIKLALRTTTVSIKQMAWDFHFSDDSFFVRYFRQRTGMTPQEFRRKYKEE